MVRDNEDVTPLLLEVSAAASLLGLSGWTLYELIREGRLPPGVVVRLGGRRIRINERALVSWIDKGGTGLEQLEGGALRDYEESKPPEAT